MAFDIDKLTRFCTEEIEKFAARHADETFYAFAIDSDMLCLNSVEAAARTLREYREREDRLLREIEKWEDVSEEDIRWGGGYRHGFRTLEEYQNLERDKKEAFLSQLNSNREPRRIKGNYYHAEKHIKELRENTGDWAYQGFAEMTRKHGFDAAAYDRHYGMSDERQKTSAYGKAMDELLRRLEEANAFECLNRTKDFYITRVEHNY